MSNITQAVFGASRSTRTKARYQWDYGQILQLRLDGLPNVYEVHFANALHGTATTSIGGPDGVTIPDVYFTSGASIWAWLYLHTGNADGETEYMVTIPVTKRAQPTHEEPTPVQQSEIEQALAALNAAVDSAEADAAAAALSAAAADRSADTAVAAADDAVNAKTLAQAARDTAVSKASEAAHSAREAALSETAAAGSASSAQRDADRAEQAAGQSGYMWFEEEDGHIIFCRTANVDVDFDIEDGRLILYG